MTNSEAEAQAEEILNKILYLLSERQISKVVDDPIDTAVSQIHFTEQSPPTHKTFNALISRFVQHVSRHGLSLCQNLTSPQALSEAMALLNQYYRNGGSTGYDGALFDACQSEPNGIEDILAFITEAIKVKKRQVYVHWVYASLVNPLDWELRRRIVDTLMARYEDNYSDNLRRQTAMLADIYRLLIKNHLEDERFLSQPGSALFSLSAETHPSNLPLLL